MFFIFTVFVFVVVWFCVKNFRSRFTPSDDKKTVLVVLGSGGHTGEMLTILKPLLVNLNKEPKWVFVAANTDSTSFARLRAFCKERNHSDSAEVQLRVIRRAREVGQSYITSVWTTLVSLSDAIILVFRESPDICLMNGPGTCLPVWVACILWRFISNQRVVITFIESFCRVKSLSLTGRVIYNYADDFFVHWPELTKNYPKAELLA